MQEQRQPSQGKRPAMRHGTYFVGRRPYEAAEVYLVQCHGVERLRHRGIGERITLDWRGEPAELLALSREILSKAVGVEPPHELEMRLALLIKQFPTDGFVLSGETVMTWLDSVGADGGGPSEQPLSLATRMRASLLRRWRR